MEGYYTEYSFVVFEQRDPYDTSTEPYYREFASLEEAEEYYSESITIIEKPQ